MDVWVAEGQCICKGILSWKFYILDRRRSLIHSSGLDRIVFRFDRDVKGLNDWFVSRGVYVQMRGF